ncbi:LPS translocon maturation chaperone LptM [Comamonas denitrificans]
MSPWREGRMPFLRPMLKSAKTFWICSATIKSSTAMRFTYLLRTLALVMAVAALGGCGQSGPLYLPGAQASAPQAAPAA